MPLIDLFFILHWPFDWMFVRVPRNAILTSEDVMTVGKYGYPRIYEKVTLQSQYSSKSFSQFVNQHPCLYRIRYRKALAKLVKLERRHNKLSKKFPV